MRSGFFEALSASNLMDWGCLRWDAQLWISPCWESYLIRIQVVYIQAFESPILFEEKPWTQLKARGLWLPGSFDAWTGVDESWSYHKEYGCKRGMVRAGSAGRMYQSDLHTSRWLAGSGRLAWVWKNKSIQNLSSSESLPQCTYWRLRWGLDFLHCSIWESFVLRSPQKHRNRCLRLKFAEHFGKSEVSLLRSGVWYCQIEFLQMGWLTRWV